MLLKDYFFDCCCLRCKSSLDPVSLESEKDRMLTSPKCSSSCYSLNDVSQIGLALSDLELLKGIHFKFLASYSKYITPESCIGYLLKFTLTSDSLNETPIHVCVLCYKVCSINYSLISKSKEDFNKAKDLQLVLSF